MGPDPRVRGPSPLPRSASPPSLSRISLSLSSCFCFSPLPAPPSNSTSPFLPLPSCLSRAGRSLPSSLAPLLHPRLQRLEREVRRPRAPGRGALGREGLKGPRPGDRESRGHGKVWHQVLEKKRGPACARVLGEEELRAPEHGEGRVLGARKRIVAQECLGAREGFRVSRGCSETKTEGRTSGFWK